jgi:hypothetical protein
VLILNQPDSFSFSENLVSILENVEELIFLIISLWKVVLNYLPQLPASKPSLFKIV